ncbi:hypothetical protein IKG28_02455 [Candidatus Saccharibacteria bacterium]|nr:hypothetical protein [Candidatus Saccharibacteria bacterium]
MTYNSTLKKAQADYNMVIFHALLCLDWEEAWPDYFNHRKEAEKLQKWPVLLLLTKKRLTRCLIHVEAQDAKYGKDVMDEIYCAYQGKRELPPEPESLFNYNKKEPTSKADPGGKIEFDPLLEDEPVKTSEELDAEKVAAESKEVEAVQVIDVTMSAGTEEEDYGEEEEGDDRDEDNEEGTEDGSGVDLRLVEKEGSDRNVDGVDNEPATDDSDDNNIASRKDPRAKAEAEEEPVCDSAAWEPAATEPFPNVEDEEDWWWSDYAEPDESRTEEVVTEDSGRDTTVPATQKPDAEDKKPAEGDKLQQTDVVEIEDPVDVEGVIFSKKYLINLYKEKGCPQIDFDKKISLLEIRFVEEI